MSKTQNAGIDWAAGHPAINRNAETGLRYGIIPQNSVSHWAVDEIFQNGEDEDFNGYIEELKSQLRGVLKDYVLSSRLNDFVESAFEAVSDSIGDCYEGTGDCARYSYQQDGYKIQTDGSGDLWVFESPFFTYAQFCSPCAPGACYLKNPLETPDDANKCYCLGPDWFDEDTPCPYPVYDLKTGQLVQPEKGAP